MKKIILLSLMALMGLTCFAQRFKVQTYGGPFYKKHFSHSIQGGLENNQPRQFVAGNKTDWGANSQKVTGRKIDGVNFLTGNEFTLSATAARVQLTNFTMYPTGDYQYGAGTGVYYPSGVTGMGYPFLGIYDESTMQVISAEYFDLSYPGITAPANAIGLQIKYSKGNNSFYISGVMADRLFADVNMNNIRGKSKGFIMKVDPSGVVGPRVLVFDPDALPDPTYPLLCLVTDLEMNANETSIAFTGMTMVAGYSNYYSPMVGMIDMNLNLQWCYAYKFSLDRYSGIDVEYDIPDSSLLVLLNTSKYPFAVMGLDYNGNITQQPVNYQLSLGSFGEARAQKMHYNNGGIIITGNCFVANSVSTLDQLLFSYEIPHATNLLAGNNYFNSYSRELVPPGSQKAVISYWAPENSIIQNDSLTIVGIYNNNNQSFGYTLIRVGGFVNQPGCLETGDVSLSGFSSSKVVREAVLTTCNAHSFGVSNSSILITYTKECPSTFKSAHAFGDNTVESGNIWQFKGIDSRGIHASLFSESNNTIYQVNVFDVMGRKIYSSSYTVNDGQKDIYMEFATNAEMYIISVSDGSRRETMKVANNR